MIASFLSVPLLSAFASEACGSTPSSESCINDTIWRFSAQSSPSRSCTISSKFLSGRRFVRRPPIQKLRLNQNRFIPSAHFFAGEEYEGSGERNFLSDADLDYDVLQKRISEVQTFRSTPSSDSFSETVHDMLARGRRDYITNLKEIFVLLVSIDGRVGIYTIKIDNCEGDIVVLFEDEEAAIRYAQRLVALDMPVPQIVKQEAAPLIRWIESTNDDFHFVCKGSAIVPPEASVVHPNWYETPQLKNRLNRLFHGDNGNGCENGC